MGTIRKSIVLCCGLMLSLASVSLADSATAYVGTVNGNNEFEVQSGGTQLYYNPQPDTEYVWMENNGSAPGTVATYEYPSGSGTFYDRDGMKTYACADVAYGQKLKDVKMSFDYSTGDDPVTGKTMSGVTVNLFITDGFGHYGIWSATSGGTHYTDTIGTDGWVTRTLDCSTIADTAGVAVYEHNGFVDEYGSPYTTINWGILKDFTIAGFYDYQRTPEGGFEAWGDIWSDMTNVADPADTTLNTYGITLNWGDTVGGLIEDGNGEIGDDATRAYGQAGRMIRDWQITSGTTSYDMTFAATGTAVPEPSTIGLLAFACGALALMRRKRS